MCIVQSTLCTHPDVAEVVDGTQVDKDAEEDGVQKEEEEELVVVEAHTVVDPAGREGRGGGKG